MLTLKEKCDECQKEDNIDLPVTIISYCDKEGNRDDRYISLCVKCSIELFGIVTEWVAESATNIAPACE